MFQYVTTDYRNLQGYIKGQNSQHGSRKTYKTTTSHKTNSVARFETVIHWKRCEKIWIIVTNCQTQQVFPR